MMEQKKLNPLEKALVCDDVDAVDDGMSWKPYYVKFGHRGRALLVIMYYYFKHGFQPPDWLQAMKAIPAAHHGTLSEIQRRAIGMGMSSQMETGMVPLQTGYKKWS